jgi:hypothetical protein
MTTNHPDTLACGLCHHQVKVHNLTKGCPYPQCRCMATPGEANRNNEGIRPIQSWDALLDYATGVVVPKASSGVSEDEDVEIACDWSDYRKDYGVSADKTVRMREHKAFTAGWKAGRHGEQSGALS